MVKIQNEVKLFSLRKLGLYPAKKKKQKQTNNNNNKIGKSFFKNCFSYN